MKLINTLLLILLIAATSFAQDYKVETSEPVNISLAGWNKVLLMRNGNTVFFHFEPRKGIIVKVFDKEHKEIASLKHLCKVFDINMLDRTHLDALTEINNEAVLFATQYIDNKETLVRLRIDGSTGKLLSEEKIAQSQSFKNRLKAYVFKNTHQDNYYILTSKEKSGYTEKLMTLRTYGSDHVLVKETPVEFDQKNLDNIALQSLTVDDNGGVFVTIEFNKIIQFPDRVERVLFVAYMPKGQDKFIYSRINLPQSFDNYSVYERYNPFTRNLNIILSVSISRIIQNGSRKEQISFVDYSLIFLEEDLSNMRYVLFNNDKIKEQVKAQLDTNEEFSGSVLKVHTNKNGLTTIIYAGKTQRKEVLGMYGIPGIRRNFGIIQFDDNGKEIFGTLLPKSALITYKASFPDVFYDNTSADEVSYSTAFNTKKDFYILFNDIEKNFGQSIATSNDSLYIREESNAMCYRLDSKREVTKSYLLGKPQEGEYKQLYTGSGDFDEETGAYAAVFLHRQGKEAQTKIAWVHFEP